MRLYISLSYDVQAILIAQFIPKIVVRIVACTYGIDIELLHNPDILQHTLPRNNISIIRVHLMAVGSLNQYRLPVHKQLRIFNLDFTETYFYRNNF